MTVVELHGVGKRYRRPPGAERRLRDLWALRRHEPYWALHDVSFAVEQGETVGLLGANGSGKSTLLRLIAGLTVPTIGNIRLGGQVGALLSLGEGFHPLLSGWENAVSGTILAGFTRREALARLESIAAFAELGERMDHPLRTFSDGMRVRLAFAVSIHVDPEILLIDEVLAVGDLSFREKCLRRLLELQDRGTTILLASHDLYQLRRICARALWLDDGNLRMIGPADEVAAAYERAINEGMAMELIEPDTASLRIGSREVEIGGVRVLDASGAETEGFRTGSPMTVELELVAHEPVADAIVSVSIHADADGHTCLDLCTQPDGHVLGPLAGKATVRLRLDRLDLAAGCYWIDVGVYEAGWDRPYDYLWQVFRLQVSGPRGRGLLQPPHHWDRT